MAPPPQSSALTERPARQNFHHTGRHSAGWRVPARLWPRCHVADCCVTDKTLDLPQPEAVPDVSGSTNTKTASGARSGSVELLPAAARRSGADTRGSSRGTGRLRRRPMPQNCTPAPDASLSARLRAAPRIQLIFWM